MYWGYGLAFYEKGKGEWSFGNGFTRNTTIFGVDSNSSSHSDNDKNNFLVLGKGPTSPKKVNINFSKANTEFCLNLHYNGGNSYFFVNVKEIYKFKADNKNINFSNQFLLGSISNNFGAIDSEEVLLKRNVYDFLVDYNSIDKY